MKDAKFKSREALMEESLNEFCEYNYENASLNRIIKRAKVSKGSFYYHFKNKEELYQHLLTKSVEAKWSFINEYSKTNAVSFDKLDIYDKFLYQAQVGMLYAEKYPKYSKLARMFSNEKGTEIYEKMLSIIGDSGSETLRKMIREAYELGDIDSSYELDFVEQLLEVIFLKYDDFFKNNDGPKRSYENLKEFIRFLKNGLGAK